MTEHPAPSQRSLAHCNVSWEDEGDFAGDGGGGVHLSRACADSFLRPDGD
jgi:hypothetical protein